MAQTHNILLLGSGGRESALAWKIRQSPLCGQLYIAPGNGGTGAWGTNLDLKPTDFKALHNACLAHNISIVLPGPEDPLVAGIADYFEAHADLRHITVCGPSKEGAMLEGSKAFAKEFMKRHAIPTAAYCEFVGDTYEAGLDYLRGHSLPIVLKADGLAGGKGVIIAQSTGEALEAYEGMLKRKTFGAAGATVLVEEFLEGMEVSVFILTDGKNYVLLPEAKDYKRIGAGDTGPNTGGMGAVSPVPFADATFMEKVRTRIIDPTVRGLAAEEISYWGFIFFGLIKVAEDPYVIEYNCRMGDPETEAVMPRLDADLVELIGLMSEGRLTEVAVRYSPQHTCTVMAVAGGYPGDYEKGSTIDGLTAAAEDALVFQAGTRESANGAIQTAGGRVVALTGVASTLAEARRKAYAAARKVTFDGMAVRADIGYEFVAGDEPLP